MVRYHNNCTQLPGVAHQSNQLQSCHQTHEMKMVWHPEGINKLLMADFEAMREENQ